MESAPAAPFVMEPYCALDSLLEDLRGLFPSALIGEPGWERLRALTRRLPLCVADSRFGFEFHLCDPSPTADFCVISGRETRLAEFFRQQTKDTAPGLAGIDFIAFLAEQDRDPHSFLARTGKGIILEYDLANSLPGSYGVPGIFFLSGGNPQPDPEELYEDPAALLAALQSAAGWEPDAAELCHVERTCSALADSGIYVSHAGVMPGRPGRAVRLVALEFDSAKLVEGLEKIHWPGDPSSALDIISNFDGVVSSRGGLGITITPEGVLPRLDLEFSRKKRDDFSLEEAFRLDRPGWRLAIGRLVERGWCLPAKAAGLSEWPRLETLFGRDGVYQVRQVISHLKVVMDRGTIYGKGYAGMDVRRTA